MTAKTMVIWDGEGVSATFSRSIELIQERAAHLGYPLTREQAFDVWAQAIDHIEEQLEEELTFAIERL